MWTLHTFWCTFSSWLQLLDSIFLSFELTRQHLLEFWLDSIFLSFELTRQHFWVLMWLYTIFVILNLVRINGRLFADLSEAVGFETCSFTRHFAGSGRSVGMKGWLFSPQLGMKGLEQSSKNSTERSPQPGWCSTISISLDIFDFLGYAWKKQQEKFRELLLTLL